MARQHAPIIWPTVIPLYVLNVPHVILLLLQLQPIKHIVEQSVWVHAKNIRLISLQVLNIFSHFVKVEEVPIMTHFSHCMMLLA